MFKYLWNSKKDKLQLWFAQKLPNWLVYWASIRLIAYATSGKYGNSNASELPAIEALKRWENRGNNKLDIH